MSIATPASLIFGSVIAGFAWGRISSHLQIPELLRLLTTPLWTGVLMVVVGWFVSIARLDWLAPRLSDAGMLGAAPVLRMAVGYGAACFLIGAVLGLPAALGWVLGYRRSPALSLPARAPARGLDAPPGYGAKRPGVLALRRVATRFAIPEGARRLHQVLTR